ncbi:GTP-binding protein [Streptomyces sioyaensis]|uniref:GTP-binding protein n=1 Tax=Streptomyces sioyaensis TaxID=67364 RepID=UPI0037A3808C
MITFIPLTGFLGAGKTTTMTAAALALQERGRKVAVITNDQGVELVDTKLVRSKLDAVAEVTGGCFCCKFEDLVEAIVALVASDQVDTVIAEAVGSCTDLQATVVRPLRRYYGEQMVVAPLTTVVDPLRFLAFDRAVQRGEPESDLSYLFRQQLTEADVIAVNKLDTIKADRATELLDRLRAEYPNAAVVGYSATGGDHLPDLLGAWGGPSGNEAVELGVDYDRYAAAEAQLAWMNQELDLVAVGETFDATAWARSVLEHLSAWAEATGSLIGHAKLTVGTGEDDFAKLSVTGAGEPPSPDRAADGPTAAARAVVNARVACEPAALDRAVQDAVTAADQAHDVTSSATTPVSFKPGYPRPVHRLAAAGA